MPDRALIRTRCLEEAARIRLAQSLREARKGASDRLRRGSTQAPQTMPDPPRPLHADWAWRPAPWSERITAIPPGRATSGTILGPGVTLHHDCPQTSPGCSQSGGAAPFGLTLHASGFSGRYLSLAIDLPEDVRTGLRRDHLLGITLSLDIGPSLCATVRLNIRHGPNLTEATARIPQSAASPLVEFDLWSIPVDPGRVSQIWLDLIVTEPPAGLTIRDAIVSRRPRAPI